MNSTLKKQGQHTRIAIQAVTGYEDSNTPETPRHWSTIDCQFSPDAHVALNDKLSMS